MALPEEIYQCQTPGCDYIYDPNRGDPKGKVPAGTRFENLPKGWRCPCCGAVPETFRPLVGRRSSKTPKCG
ncbi:MAG: rubredoxin [Deltaproteobacteria bacterium]|nr:rubredoxin [Deltaproteobacteria bacterium]